MSNKEPKPPVEGEPNSQPQPAAAGMPPPVTVAENRIFTLMLQHKKTFNAALGEVDGQLNDVIMMMTQQIATQMINMQKIVDSQAVVNTRLQKEKDDAVKANVTKNTEKQVQVVMIEKLNKEIVALKGKNKGKN